MTKEEAKKILREDPKGNIWKRMEAILIAEKELGERCTISDVMRWAEEEDEQSN